MSEVKSEAKLIRQFALTFFKWLLIAGITGVLGGLIGSAFHLSVGWATELRGRLPWLLYLLPVAGLAIAGLYRLTDMESKGTNAIIDSVHSGERVPILLLPAIFLSTVLTHLFGGSAGREGAALQIGGSLGFSIGRAFRLDDKDRRIATLSGMSAVFSALFGTPLTATLFVLEVISVGVLYYSALVPCLVSALLALWISSLLGVEPTRFVLAAQELSAPMLLRIAVLAVLCALMSVVFCVVMHKSGELFRDKLKNSFLRAAVGGVTVVALTLLSGTRECNGAGMEIVARAIEQGTAGPWWLFALKLVLTAVTIGSGFKGGEVVPTFFVGACFGCTLGALLGIPAGFAAAIGLICLFCGAVNCPVGSILLSVELFGSGSLIYFALACGIAYMLSGYFGLYSSQKILYSKLRAEFININAK